MTRPSSPEAKAKVGLPVRCFLFTLDQIAYMASMPENELRARCVHFDGRSVGAPPKSKLLARALPHPENGRSPDWRVAEEEVVRWLRHQGYVVRNYDRAFVSS